MKYDSGCTVHDCSCVDNGVPDDVPSERGSGTLYCRVTQLPRDVVVHQSGAHYYIHWCRTAVRTQAFLHREA